MKLKLSKRWFANLLIFTFGLLILLTTVFASLNLFSADAGAVVIAPLGVNYPIRTFEKASDVPQFTFTTVEGKNFLEVYNPNIVSASFRAQSSDYPGYKLSYWISDYNGQPWTGYFAIVPLASFDYLTNSNPKYSYIAKEDNSGYQLLQNAYTYLNGQQGFNSSLAETSINNYRRAIAYSASSYRINNDTLYSTGYMIPDDSDQDVAISDSFGQQVGTSLAVSIAADHTYITPRNDSLAQQILSGSIREANSIGDSDSADKIRAALGNYNSQIQSTSGNEGLTISSVDEIDFGGTTQISFSADPSKLLIPSGKHLQTILLNIDSINVCTINAETGTVSGQGCSEVSKSSWQFNWNQSISSEVGTNHTGTRILTAKAFWAPTTQGGNNSAGVANKSVTVLEQGGVSSQPGSFGISITVPNSLHQVNNKEIITISANLDQLRTAAAGQSPSVQFKYITWWVCNADQATIASNNTVPNTCFKKGHLIGNSGDDLSSQTGILTSKLDWDATASQIGAHSILVKAFGSAEPKEYVDGSKTVSTTVNITDNKIEGEGDDGGVGDEGGGENGIVGSGPVTPGWAANFRQSAIDSVNKLIARIGWFTLTILAIFAVLGIIIAGMKYITSGGDSKGAETGKKALLFSVYGIIIAALCVMLVEVTINEIRGIVGNRLQEPSNPETLLLPGFGGTNASITSIIGHDPGNPNDPSKNGFIWRVILLAVYYAEAVAVFYILYASFLYITSFGDEGKAENGKKTLVWAVIGLAFVLSANFLLVLFAGIIA